MGGCQSRCLSQVMQETHTWMGDSVKAVVTYSCPWWKEEGLSGDVYSNDGSMVQLSDQSVDRGAALVGFLDCASSRWSKEEQERCVIYQLTRLYGDKTGDYLEYRDTGSGSGVDMVSGQDTTSGVDISRSRNM